jgi:dsRNA-specific ribonuclease
MNKKSVKSKKFIEKNYHFLQWAFTLHMHLQDYNYETLETLGDSILKMLATIIVYHVHEINDIETDVGELVYNRATIICNLHLYSISDEKKIYSYLLRYPKEIMGYTFPLEHEFMNTGRINIAEKILADIIESSIGAIFLTTRCTRDCFNYIKKLDIPFVEKKDKKFQQTRGNFAKDKIWKNDNYDILVNKAYESIGEKMKNFDEFIFPEKVNDILKNYEMEKNITLINLMEKYILRCNSAKNNFKGDVNSLNYLQKCRIFYDFKNVDLLEQAMTHKSKNSLNYKNYEKLELLGDSIVESFISQYTFCIFGPYLFEDEDDINIISEIEKNSKNAINEELIRKNAKIFNNKYMTHIKSYLCSNYFMCKLSILIGLPRFIQFGQNDINNKNKLAKFLGYENVKGFFESQLNSYVSTEILQPKFVADLFEALIGAIYMDSDLKTTYDFLHLIYGPSICYSCLFLQDLPFSIVADFTERCSKEIKIVPSFRNVTKEEILNNGIEFDSNKAYLKLTIGPLFSCIEKGDNEEKAKENLSEKGITFLDEIRFKGPSGK